MSTPAPAYLLPPVDRRVVDTLAAHDLDFRSGTARDTVCDGPRQGAGPDEPWLSVGDCESLTGPATLCGWSAFEYNWDADNPGAWEGQYRKWRDRTKGGHNGFQFYRRDTRYPPAEYTWHDALKNGHGGTLSIRRCSAEEAEDGCFGCKTTGSFTFGQAVVYGGYTSTPGEVLPGSTYEDLADPEQSPDGTTPGIPGYCDAGYTIISLTRYGVNAGGTGYNDLENPPGFFTSLTCYSDAYEELSEEAYLFDELKRLLDGGSEDVEQGELCCTSLSSADLTTPQSTSPISMTGTAVRVPLTVFGCEPVGAPFAAAVTVQRTVDGVTTTREYILGVRCFIPTYFQVPLAPPGTPGWCFVGAVLV